MERLEARPGTGAPTELTLLDWKRRIFELYAEVRASPDPAHAWNRWRSVRDDLFASHPQSPLAEEARPAFRGAAYFDYDPELRVLADVRAVAPDRLAIATSQTVSYEFTRFASAEFVLRGSACALEVYWLEGYGGGVFVPFGDETNGEETYGGGRYLLDTVKGSDLGTVDGRLVLDFNFAYNPSCAYEPNWICPLPPPANRLPLRVEAGERAYTSGV